MTATETLPSSTVINAYVFYNHSLCVCVCLFVCASLSLLSIVSQHCLLSSVLVILVALAMWLFTLLKPNYTVELFLFKLKLCFFSQD